MTNIVSKLYHGRRQKRLKRKKLKTNVLNIRYKKLKKASRRVSFEPFLNRKIMPRKQWKPPEVVARRQWTRPVVVARSQWKLPIVVAKSQWKPPIVRTKRQRLSPLAVLRRQRAYRLLRVLKRRKNWPFKKANVKTGPKKDSLLTWISQKIKGFISYKWTKKKKKLNWREYWY